MPFSFSAHIYTRSLHLSSDRNASSSSVSQFAFSAAASTRHGPGTAFSAPRLVPCCLPETQTPLKSGGRVLRSPAEHRVGRTGPHRCSRTLECCRRMEGRRCEERILVLACGNGRFCRSNHRFAAARSRPHSFSTLNLYILFPTQPNLSVSLFQCFRSSRVFCVK